RRLLDEKVGMTVDDLAAFGFDRMHLHERLKIAQLPAPLLERILTGKVKRDVARKLTRLTMAQQERVVQLACAGEELTAEQVKETLRAQIDAGLVPLQTSLGQGWSEAQPKAYSAPQTEQAALKSQSVPVNQDIQPSERVMPAAELSVPTPSLQEVDDVLRAFAQSDAFQAVPRAVQTLTQALVQQLSLTLRCLSPLPHPDIHEHQDR
ncbi:MAG TPA: hypothetical protein VKU38_12370, partial [Ktedonobacteraceae bacterium]|nr:hypothetical protein [Ktedonobacteraceae bacterium]